MKRHKSTERKTLENNVLRAEGKLEQTKTQKHKADIRNMMRIKFNGITSYIDTETVSFRISNEKG